jgi:hypothetical protein
LSAAYGGARPPRLAQVTLPQIHARWDRRGRRQTLDAHGHDDVALPLPNAATMARIDVGSRRRARPFRLHRERKRRSPVSCGAFSIAFGRPDPPKVIERNTQSHPFRHRQTSNRRLPPGRAYMHPTPIFDKTRARTGSANVAKPFFRNETPGQRFDHRIIAHKYRVAGDRRSRRADPKTYIRIRELERLFFDRYGAMLPNDDAGLDDIFVMANHLAQLAEPDQRITAWLRRWAPWHGEGSTVALIRSVTPKPLKWRADVLARQLGLDYATRMRLRITTIGAIDCGKAKRAALRRKRNNAAKRASRARDGAASHATSAARTKPWLALGISPRSYYRKRLNGTGGTNSGTACPEDIVVDAKQCHDAKGVFPTFAVETVPHALEGAREAPATDQQQPPDWRATSKDKPLIAILADNQTRPFIIVGCGGGCDTGTIDTWLALRKRGKLCRSWQSFASFLSDVGKKPSWRHLIIRVDTDSLFQPGNAKWRIAKEYRSPRRSTG